MVLDGIDSLFHYPGSEATRVAGIAAGEEAELAGSHTAGATAIETVEKVKTSYFNCFRVIKIQQLTGE